MKQFAAWFLAALLLCAYPGAAQRQGRGGNPPNKSSHGGGPPPMTDFEKALALQPTANQVSLFNILSQSLEAAHTRVQNVEKIAVASPRPSDFHLLVLGMQDLVDKARDDSDIFVGSLSAPQKSKFKTQTKKLEKANAELARQEDALNEEVERDENDGQKLQKAAEGVEKALAGVRAEQLRLGEQLGITSLPQ